MMAFWENNIGKLVTTSHYIYWYSKYFLFLVPFLETPDNFPGQVSIFSSSFIYQLKVIIGASLVICFTKL